MKVLTTLTMILMLTAAAALAGGVIPGDEAPDFVLTDTAGETHALAAYLAEGQVVVLEWFNPDCPFIVKHHKNAKTMNETYAAFKEQGVTWLAINSGAAGKQGAGLARNVKAVQEYEIPFPVLMDPDGAVGRAYGAKTTPHMFVIRPDGTVAYTGAIDDDRSAGAPGKNNYVADALAAVLAGEAPAKAETLPYGCSVKY